MQQAYLALRIVSEAQTIRMMLATHPGELLLKELCSATTTLDTESSNGVKVVILDFAPAQDTSSTPGKPLAQPVIDEACAAIQAIPQPVLAVVRATLSPPASTLALAADLTIVASDAQLTVPDASSNNTESSRGRAILSGGHEAIAPTIPRMVSSVMSATADLSASSNNSSSTPSVMSSNDILSGAQALRLGYVTWAVPAQQINKEMERILDMLRGKSAVALRHTKASVRLAQTNHATQLDALSQVNTFYLDKVMQTVDAHEGLKAFLEKRPPEWKNA